MKTSVPRLRNRRVPQAGGIGSPLRGVYVLTPTTGTNVAQGFTVQYPAGTGQTPDIVNLVSQAGPKAINVGDVRVWVDDVEMSEVTVTAGTLSTVQIEWGGVEADATIAIEIVGGAESLTALNGMVNPSVIYTRAIP